MIILFDQAAINPLDLAFGPALSAGLKPLFYRAESHKRNYEVI